MRRSNCLNPTTPPKQPRGLSKNVCAKKCRAQDNEVKKDGAPENEWIKVIK